MDFSLLQHHSIDNPLLLDPEIDRTEFKKVFMKGRGRLRKFKIRLIRNFVLKNPLNTVLMVLKEPKHYFLRVYRQIFKQ
jgi:hypothetical protein